MIADVSTKPFITALAQKGANIQKVYSVMPEGEKIGGTAVIGGDNLPSHSWNRVN